MLPLGSDSHVRDLYIELLRQTVLHTVRRYHLIRTRDSTPRLKQPV